MPCLGRYPSQLRRGLQNRHRPLHLEFINKGGVGRWHGTARRLKKRHQFGEDDRPGLGFRSPAGQPSSQQPSPNSSQRAGSASNRTQSIRGPYTAVCTLDKGTCPPMTREKRGLWAGVYEAGTNHKEIFMYGKLPTPRAHKMSPSKNGVPVLIPADPC